jgi:hypothetical protein
MEKLDKKLNLTDLQTYLEYSINQTVIRFPKEYNFPLCKGPYIHSPFHCISSDGVHYKRTMEEGGFSKWGSIKLLTP